jgi:ribose transport system substrate-binding protein
MIRKLYFLSVLVLLFSCSDSDQIEIALIPKGTDIQYWKGLHAGGEKAAQELGLKLFWQGPQKESDREQQINIVQNFIARGIDAIALCPLDEVALTRPVSAARKRGIPVIIVDSGLQGDDYDAFIATDNFGAGELAAKHLFDMLGGKGEVILVRFSEGSNSTGLREDGFLDWMQKNAPDIKILSSDQYTGATMELALKTGQNLLNKFPQVDGLFCPNEMTTFGLTRAIKTVGKAGQVKLVGFDYTEPIAEALREGIISGVVVQDPFTMGYQSVHAAYDVVMGKTVEPVVETKVIFVTKENINDPDIVTVTTPDIAKWLKNK